MASGVSKKSCKRKQTKIQLFFRENSNQKAPIDKKDADGITDSTRLCKTARDIVDMEVPDRDRDTRPCGASGSDTHRDSTDADNGIDGKPDSSTSDQSMPSPTTVTASTSNMSGSVSNDQMISDNEVLTTTSGKCNEGSSKVDACPPPPKVRKVKRNFNNLWLKLYSWLRFVPHSQSDSSAGSDEISASPYMFCQLCTEANKKNAMVKSARNTNFQNSTLTRHACLPEHKMLLEAPQLAADLEHVLKKHSSKQDIAIKVLMKCVHWLSREDIALVKYKSLLELLFNFTPDEIEALKVLKNSPVINYDSSSTSDGLLDCLADVVNDRVVSDLQKSEFVTALADESTDISNNKRLVIYAQIISEDMKPLTRFITNIECEDASGKGIANAILKEFESRGVQPRKIMSLGSDGASVMTGKTNGCSAIMRHSNPHMYNVHCVAHRLSLCTSQAAEKIPKLKDHQKLLTDLFYYFKGSAKREGRLKEIQSIVDDPKLKIREIHSVRWLSYFEALSSVWRTLDSLLSYFAERPLSDPKACGLRKKMATDSFLSITYMMMDMMAPVTILSQFFQTENVDVALVKVKVDLCLSDLVKVKTLQTPYLQKLTQDFPTGSKHFKGHEIKTSNFNLQSLACTFADALISNIQSRFPDDDILTSFSILSMRPLTFLSSDELKEYGNREIQTLCDFYGSQQVMEWKDDHGVKHVKKSEPLVDSGKTLTEWTFVKNVVKAEMYPRDNMCNLWHLIWKYHQKDFPNLCTLAKLALTCGVHTAGCERGFSVQNRILTTFRNRLNIETQRKLMLIKLDASNVHDFNYDDALEKWKKQKDRRVYELKTMKLN